MPTVGELNPAQRSVWDKATPDGQARLAAKYGITTAPSPAVAAASAPVDAPATAASLGMSPEELQARLPHPSPPDDMARPAPAPGLLPEPSVGERSLAVGPPEPPTVPIGLKVGLGGVKPSVADAAPDLTPREWAHRHQLLADVVVPMAGGLAALPAAEVGAPLMVGGAKVAQPFLNRAAGTLLRSGLFAGGAEAADAGLRAAYGDPQKTARELAVSAGLNFAAPLGGEVFGKIARRVSGVTARAEELAAAQVAAQAKATAAREAADDAMAIGFPKIETRLKGIGNDIRNSLDNVVPRKVETNARKMAVASKRDAYKDMLSLDTAATDARIAGAGGGDAVDIQRATAGKFKDLYDLGQHDFGEVFEAARAPHVDKEIPEAVRNAVSKSAAESLESSGAFAVGGDVVGPMQRLKALAPGSPEAVPGAIPEGGLPPGVAEANDRAAGRIAAKKGEDQAVPKIGELLEIKGRLQSSMKRGGPDRHLAAEGLSIINEALADLGVTGTLPDQYVDKYGTWQEFAARFSNWRAHMDKGFLRRLYTAKTADDLTGLFKSEKLLALLSHAEPEDVQALRTAFHDLVVQKNLQDKPNAIFQIIGGTKAMDALYGASANDALKWARVSAKTEDLTRLIQADPRIGREMDALRNHWTGVYVERGYQKMQEVLVSEFQHFGPAGKAYARDLAGLSPSQAMLKYKVDVKGDPAAFREALLDATHAETLQSEVGKRIPTMLGQKGPLSTAYRGVALYHAGMAGVSALSGSPSKYHMALGAGSLALDMGRFLRRGFVGTLETPHVAKYLEYINDPTRQNMRNLIRMSSQVAAADILHHSYNALAFPKPQQGSPDAEPPPLPIRPEIIPAHGQFPQGSAPATPPPAQQQMAQGPQAGPTPPPPMAPHAPQGPPPPDPVKVELAIHQMQPWKFRNVQTAGSNFTDAPTVAKFQAAFDQGAQHNMERVVASPVYKQATPKAQQSLLRWAMFEARRDAIGTMRKEIAGKIKDELRSDQVASAPDSLR